MFMKYKKVSYNCVQISSRASQTRFPGPNKRQWSGGGGTKSKTGVSSQSISG